MKCGLESATTLIVGYGNELRGDDAVGRHAARELRRLGFNALDVHQLTPELSDPLAQTGRAFFIDSDASLPPGAIRVTMIEPACDRSIDHVGGPAYLLSLASELYGHVPEARLIGIGPASYDFEEGLSETVARAVAEVVRNLSAHLAT